MSVGLITIGCLPEPLAMPQWDAPTEAREAEYVRFLQPGTGSIVGQAFLVQQGGATVKAAGRTVTLDPATSIGNEWWAKAGKKWVLREYVPPSTAFGRARKSTVADADGRFKFTNLAPGKYYLRTEVTWQAPYAGIQGGLVCKEVEVGAGQSEVIMSSL